VKRVGSGALRRREVSACRDETGMRENAETCGEASRQGYGPLENFGFAQRTEAWLSRVRCDKQKAMDR